MAKNLDKILILDLESTCWKDNKRPAGQFNDIIEIGLVLYDLRSLDIIENESILVIPTTSEISKFCTSLTGWRPENILPELGGLGISFGNAITKLRKEYKSDKFAWASWGDYDRRQFERQCKREGVKYPFGITHTNIKYMFALLRGARRETGVRNALKILGMGFEGSPHKGKDDAKNIARILTKLLMNQK